MSPSKLFKEKIDMSLPHSKAFESKHWEKSIDTRFQELGDVLVISSSPVSIVCATFTATDGRFITGIGYAKCRTTGPMRLRDRFSKTRGMVIAAGRCLKDVIEQFNGHKQYIPIIDMYIGAKTMVELDTEPDNG